MPYCQALGLEGAKIIESWVRSGGRYLGVCAGAYYAAEKIEFAVDNDEYKIVADRDLGFFAGVARGPVYSGFKYGTEEGAHRITLLREGLDAETKAVAGIYFNGGCAFFPRQDPDAEQSEILARFHLAPDYPIAGVFRKIDKGSACLYGAHIEYDHQPDVLMREALLKLGMHFS